MLWFVYAVLAAVCFGLRGILYQWTSQRPINRSLMLLGVYTSGCLVALAANLVVGQQWTAGALVGILMGIFSFISNASMYKGYAVGKASLVALMTALPPVIVVMGAYVIWGEALNVWQLGSFAIIMIGLLMIRYSQELKWTELGGIQWGLLALLFFSLTDLSVKLATLLMGETLPTLALMYATGSLLFGCSWCSEQLRGRMRAKRVQELSSDPAQQPALARTTAETAASKAAYWGTGRVLGWGMIVGLSNIGGMLLIMPAFRDGITGLVSAISAMNVVLVLIYARFYLKETMKRRELAGLVCALAGIVLLRLAA